MSAHAPQAGGLVYLMGASGSGKDTLLRLAAQRISPDEPILFAHRYITRPAADAGENAIYLDPAAFARRAALGCFALAWESHGLSYGIGVEIDAWLRAGAWVVVNGSRAHLAQACARYPGLRAVEVRVWPEELARRLAARGRETPADIAGRLTRGRQAFDVPAGCDYRSLNNDGLPEAAAESLLDILRFR